MRLPHATGVVLLQSWCIAAVTPEDAVLSVRAHSRAIAKRAGRDFGTFTVDCTKAAGACNNACYHIHCVNPATATMVYDSTISNDRNRRQSGCQTADGSVCNKMPFSQVFHNPQNKSPGDMSINCDEWPMATIKQSDFVPGTVRISLRCMNRNENSSGGAQLNVWTTGTNAKGPKKTCSGTIQDGDLWQVTFDTTGADSSAVQHCLNPSTCSGDPFAFHMTQLDGHLSFPYNTATDNHYAQDSVGKVLLQCSITVKRKGNSGFTVTVFDPAGVRKGQVAEILAADKESLLVNGLPQPLKVTRSAVYAASGAGNQFNHMSSPVFSWTGDTKGSSSQVAPDGSYCTVSTAGEPALSQDLKCYFPCPSA